MRALFRLTMALTVLVWCATAQRGGGGHGGGGGGFHGGGGGFHGSMGGGYGAGGYHGGAGIGSGYRGGYGGVGRGYGGYGYGGIGRGYGAYGFGRGYGYGRGRGYGGWPYYGWGYPGWGIGYWPGYYGYYNSYPYNYYDPDTYAYADPSYAYSPGPAVAYAPAQGDPYGQGVATGNYGGPVHSAIRSYDEYGQETARNGATANSSPIYLIAQKSGEIQAAESYWITGQTLHYVTLDRQEKQLALGSIDRALTEQLNRERHVSIALPAQ